MEHQTAFAEPRDVNWEYRVNIQSREGGSAGGVKRTVVSKQHLRALGVNRLPTGNDSPSYSLQSNAHH